MSLTRFGFTPTEDKAYRTLLRLGPSTGYALARELGIARANAYQALEGLVRRGAARRASSIPVRFTALSPGQLVSSLERGFRNDLEELEDSLARLPPLLQERADEIGVLAAASDLLDAAGQACRTASAELLVVTGPWASSLEPHIRNATERGVAARVVSLGRPAPAAAAVREVPPAELRAYWGGLPVAVVADRATAVCGVVEAEGRASGVSTSLPGLVPFVRHLLRRELASP